MPVLLIRHRYLPVMAACLALAVSDAGAAAVNVKTATYAELAYYPEHATAAEVIARFDSKVSAKITVTAIEHGAGEQAGEGTMGQNRPPVPAE